ncbi:MAG TPA: SDR family oxidoreductase [Burkholderiaceae bacterium]|nr:SDR family oxidoreductase [Burkholderiaceae bacterium]
MDLELRGKRVLITGGSKGIGLACARAFLKEGAEVAITSRARANLDHALAELSPLGRVTAHAADLIDGAQAARMVDEVEAQLGELDVLVTSAGAARRTPPDELNADVWRAAMDAKYFTYVNVLTPVIQRMAARRRGSVVNVIGAGGKVASAVHMPGGAANAALMLVTAGLASAYGPVGIRVNAVNPGATLTDRLKEGLALDSRIAGISTEEAMSRLTARTALKRLAEPAEIADAVVYLASARASYVSGAILSMDGVSTPIVV